MHSPGKVLDFKEYDKLSAHQWFGTIGQAEAQEFKK
jgi:hypothetical protein